MSITEQVGIKVGNVRADMWKNGEVDRFIGKCKASKIGYVLVQTHNDGWEASSTLVDEWIAACNKYGIAFGLWGVTYTEPERDAMIHGAHIRRYRPAVAAINAEVYYQGNPNLGGEEKIRWDRNGRYLNTFDRELLLGEAPVLVLNTTGAASGNNTYWMPHDQWKIRHEVHAQAYYNAYDDYRPDLCEAHWLRAGWPIEKIKLTLGCYQGESGSKGLDYHVPDYLPLLQGLRIVGVNLFVAETLTDADFISTPSIIAMGRAKAPATSPLPTPVVDPAINRSKALTLLDESVEWWRSQGMKEETIAIQRQTLAWRVLNTVQSGENVRAIKSLLDGTGTPTP